MAEDDTIKFLNAEFNAMDKDNDGKLSSTEISEILIYQGIDLGERGFQTRLIEKYGTLLTKEQFQEFMQSIPNKKRDLRTIFKSFHQERDGYTSKESILEKLTEMRINNAQALIDQMEIGVDDGGLVSYENFLRVYFKSKQQTHS
ncbi:calcium-binding mitochondrial carrier protein SCaMC-1 [Octopus sinensis]|uniref:Calcium-binding mitochondrial carrier protein SCaMC-1 n=1 Tax=Octopus sinensis TaxID=2607531 RepID=A0A6P7SCY2_9MOLL|nr:calcium-binding mitochondrial carrier protein SCaMC-1 [Octopus sinensis]